MSDLSSVNVKVDEKGSEASPASVPRKAMKFDTNNKSKRHIELMKWDKDGDGELTIEEILEAAGSMRGIKQQRRWLLWGIGFVLIFTFLLLCCMLGVTYWAVQLSKDYRVHNADQSKAGITFMSDVNGKPLSSNMPHVNVNSFQPGNASTLNYYSYLVEKSPATSLHRRRMYSDAAGDEPSLHVKVIGTFDINIVLNNIDVLAQMSEVTAVVADPVDGTTTNFHLGKVTSYSKRNDHIYIETKNEQDIMYDVDCPLSGSVCFVSEVSTSPVITSKKRYNDCCGDCYSCAGLNVIGNCRECARSGRCSLSEGPLGYKYTSNTCQPWSRSCGECDRCGDGQFGRNNYDLCEIQCGKKCPPQCFPENSMVTLQDGSELPIQLLKAGDVVAAIDAQGEVVYTPFLGFMHSGRNPQPENYKMAVYTYAGKKQEFYASPDHRVYIKEANNADWLQNPQPARSLKKGDTLLVMNENKFVDVVVESVEDVFRYGHYGPLTNEGTVIVSDVAASCYVESGPGHYYSDIFMTPVKWYLRSKIWINKNLENYGIVPQQDASVRAPAPQFPQPDSYINWITNEVLIPAAVYLK